MSRDQRVDDNWALVHACAVAAERSVPLVVVVTLSNSQPGATARQYGFMLRGLKEVEQRLSALHIPFVLLRGDHAKELMRYAHNIGAGVVVTDFSPLKTDRVRKERVAKGLTVRFDEIDAHNIVPAWIASPKLEFAAYTLRPRIRRLLPDFLVPIPPLKTWPVDRDLDIPSVNWDATLRSVKTRADVAEVTWIVPGETAARDMLRCFIKDRSSHYDTVRNDPTIRGQSDLSPYLHFGQISAQRVALEVSESVINAASRDAFLEELIIRRELSDNFCLYNPDYDSVEGFPAWARRSLDEHRNDLRPYRYALSTFASAGTHDPLWNAAQSEMVTTGKMHGYMRMYWAKKILEWTPSPEEAMAIAIDLNDTYELDGMDPNGYAGIAWSIGGVHDRAWAGRPVFGKVRYMNSNGCRRKFDTDSYIANHARSLRP
jgi:deoxyribodipyrimidine photo-lyase